MYTFFIFMLGFVSCLVMLYAIGKSKHAGHGDGEKTASGPSSRTNTKENVVSIVKRDAS